MPNMKSGTFGPLGVSVDRPVFSVDNDLEVVELYDVPLS